MKYINHITLNTGDLRKTTPDEVDKKLYFYFMGLYRDSLEKGRAEIRDGYWIKSTADDIGVLITLYGKSNAPIITTAISNKDYNGTLWALMHNDDSIPLKTKENKKIELPYIADKIHPTAFHHLDALVWSGDFAKCMGWLVLAPHEIR